MNTIATKRNRISINPYNGDFKPKNKNDQQTFNINWIPNVINDFFLSFALFCHIKYNDIPIRKYSEIHTGPNNQPGGLKSGFINVEYQVDNVEAVNTDPIIPANSQTLIETTNLKILLYIYVTM